MTFLYGRQFMVTFGNGELPKHGKISTQNCNNGIESVKEEKPHPVQDVLTVNQLKLLVD